MVGTDAQWVGAQISTQDATRRLLCVIGTLYVGAAQP